MAKELFTVRDVDEEVLQRFKSRASGKGMKMGTALSLAMEQWIKNEEAAMKPHPENILRLRGLVKTKSRVRWSEEVDQTLYGSEK